MSYTIESIAEYIGARRVESMKRRLIGYLQIAAL